MKENRKRNICIKVRLTPEEYDCLCGSMAEIGITNREAYIRKMILDGIIVKLDVPEIKDMISQLCYSGNNINQIAKRLNETGRIYATDIDDVKANQQCLIEKANTIISKLASLK